MQTGFASYYLRSLGYKPTAAKTVEEYAKLDAEDESLARWKASLGITESAAKANTGPKVFA
jgi:Rho GDP-dissociation inhibitor